MKKTILIVFALSVLLGFASCSGGTGKTALMPYSVNFEHKPFGGENNDENHALICDYYVQREKEIVKDIPENEDFFKKLDYLMTAESEKEMLEGHEYYEDDTDGKYSARSDFYSRYVSSKFVFDYYCKTITKESVPYVIKYLAERAPDTDADDAENYNRISFAKEYMIFTCADLLGADIDEIRSAGGENECFTQTYALLYFMNGNK